MSSPASRMASRRRLLVWLLVITPLGIASKAYAGPGEAWVNTSSGGVLYVVFWTLVAAWLVPGTSTRRLAAVVLAVTCALETLQLWHPPFLDRIRATYLGHAVLGSTFSWWDYPHYVLGALLGAGAVETTRLVRDADGS